MAAADTKVTPEGRTEAKSTSEAVSGPALSTVRQYVRDWPSLAGSADAVALTERSTTGSLAGATRTETGFAVAVAAPGRSADNLNV